MATKRKDWKAEWKTIAKENRKLAKRANQRLVRLERAAERPGMASVKEFAYKVAMRDLTSLGKTGEKKRFTEAPKLMQINDGSKNLTGDALYRANVMRAKSEQKMLKSFLSAASSTIGKARAYEDEGIKATEGVRAVWDLYNAVSIPIVGVGGICDYRDAVEYIMAGASAFQIGSAILTEGVDVFEKINGGLVSFMKEFEEKNA